MTTGTGQDSTERFSHRVADYVRFRPAYPAALLDTLWQRIHPRVVADIGAGSGIFSSQLLDRGAQVLAVEPNTAMRDAAEKLLGERPGFVSLDGRAEATGLDTDSVDLIAAAQAFHWFNNEASRGEFRRILQPGGSLALIWNRRDLEHPFQQAYQQLLIEFSPEYGRVNHMNLGDADLEPFFAAGQMSTFHFDNVQQLDFTALMGRLESASYCPDTASNAYRSLRQALESLFERFARDGKVDFVYDCQLFLGPMPA